MVELSDSDVFGSNQPTQSAASKELSDADVFGAPHELSDDDIFGTTPKSSMLRKVGNAFIHDAVSAPLEMVHGASALAEEGARRLGRTLPDLGVQSWADRQQAGLETYIPKPGNSFPEQAAGFAGSMAVPLIGAGGKEITAGAKLAQTGKLAGMMGLQSAGSTDEENKQYPNATEEEKGQNLVGKTVLGSALGAVPFGRVLGPEAETLAGRAAQSATTGAAINVGLLPANNLVTQQTVNPSQNIIPTMGETLQAAAVGAVGGAGAHVMGEGLQALRGNPAADPSKLFKDAPHVNDIAAAAAKHGVDPLLPLTFARIESDFGRAADTNTGNNYGIFQLNADNYNTLKVDPRAARTDPSLQIDAGVQWIKKMQTDMAQSLGRAPTVAEVYLAHQQGAAGATALIRAAEADPNASAVGAIRRFYKTDGIADSAIEGNTPGKRDPNITARDFINRWNERVNHFSGGAAGAEAGSRAAANTDRTTNQPPQRNQEPPPDTLTPEQRAFQALLEERGLSAMTDEHGVTHYVDEHGDRHQVEEPKEKTGQRESSLAQSMEAALAQIAPFHEVAAGRAVFRDPTTPDGMPAEPAVVDEVAKRQRTIETLQAQIANISRTLVREPDPAERDRLGALAQQKDQLIQAHREAVEALMPAAKPAEIMPPTPAPLQARPAVADVPLPVPLPAPPRPATEHPATPPAPGSAPPQEGGVGDRLPAAGSESGQNGQNIATENHVEQMEPPTVHGHVRVYHSGSVGEGDSGRFVSTNREYASNYRSQLPLHYLDIPETDPRVNNEDYPDQGVRQGFTFNFETTPEEASRLRPISRDIPPAAIPPESIIGKPSEPAGAMPHANVDEKEAPSVHKPIHEMTTAELRAEHDGYDDEGAQRSDNFDEQFDRHQAVRNEYANRLGAEPGGLVLESKTHDGRSLGAFISPEPDGTGRWRITWFDKRGFSGDTQRATKAEAVRDAIREGYSDTNRNLLREFMKEPSFHEGNAETERVRKWNEEQNAKRIAAQEAARPHSGAHTGPQKLLARVLDKLKIPTSRRQFSGPANARTLVVKDQTAAEHDAIQNEIGRQIEISVRRSKAARDSTIKNPDLLQFLAMNGGIHDMENVDGVMKSSGELKHMGADKWFQPKLRNLVRNTGMPLDDARELAEEHGYLPEGSDVNALLEAIRTNLNPKTPVRPIEGHMKAHKAKASPFAPEPEGEPEFDADAALRVYDNNNELSLSDDEHDRARDLIEQGHSIEDAYMQVSAERAQHWAETDNKAAGGDDIPFDMPGTLEAFHGEDPFGDRTDSLDEAGHTESEAHAGGEGAGRSYHEESGDHAPPASTGEEGRSEPVTEPSYGAHGEYQGENYVLPQTEHASAEEVNARAQAEEARKTLEIKKRESKIKQDDLFAESPKKVEPPATEPIKNWGADNKLFTSEGVAERLARIKSKIGNQMHSGPGFDDEMLRDCLYIAGYHVEAGARSFADYARKMVETFGEAIRPYLRMSYEGLRHYPGFEAAREMTPAAEVDKMDMATVGREEPSDVSGGRLDLERDRGPGNGGTGHGLREEGVPDANAGHAQGPGGREQGTGGEGGDITQRQGGLFDDHAPPLGEAGNSKVRAEASRSGSRPPRRGGHHGGGDSGFAGTPINEDRADTVSKSADDGPRVETALDRQIAAEDIPVKLGNAENIKATLPFLQEGQHSDVLKAETRFAKPNGHGMMFTNGTGTGKTYSGLGIIKRFAKLGKDNILIAVPSQDILSDWIKAGKNLGLNISSLADTKDAGNGIVITTYANLGQNRTLADRKWDLVVNDESHNLMKNQEGGATEALDTLRAITNHPDGVQDKARMLLRDRWDQVPKGDAPPRVLIDDTRALAATIAAQPRSKVVFLSATPFAYVKAIDYAHGYLFDYNEGRPIGGSLGYNQPSNKDAFYMSNFGYRMRTNKLTEPDAGVNSEVMERQFHEKLVRDGVLSGRALDVDQDYDRKFVLVNDAIGQKIDAALKWLREADKKFRPLEEVIRGRFDYLSRMRLLEAIKATHAVQIIKDHMALGRKVVVFHDYNTGGGFNPFEISKGDFERMGQDGISGTDREGLEKLYADFRAAHREICSANFSDMHSPIITMQEAFPTALIYNGTVPNKARTEAKRLFNEDGNGHNLIVVQSAAGEAGISLHDTTGNHQRVIVNLGMPVRPTTAVQEEGRIYRIGQKSNAIFRYLNTGTDWERFTFANKIAERASTAENLALGNQARTLKQSFINAFLDSAEYHPSREDGIGGKAEDARAAADLSDFDRARSFYYAQQKLQARRGQREGADYFPTPEPIGLKMVEWANIKEGDRVLEPSAGHGAIARWLPETSHRTLIEPSATLASRAALASPGATVKQENFEDLHATNKYDAIIMNPPFGHGGALAVNHLARAATHLRNGGRIVALLPEGGLADKSLVKFLEDQAEAGGSLRLISVARLPVATFERAGTGVKSRIWVLEKQTDHALWDKMPRKDFDFSNAENVGELFDRIEFADLPPRLDPITKDVVNVPENSTITMGGVEFKLNTKTGVNTDYAYVAKPASKIGKGQFADVAWLADKNNGMYNFGSFLFKTDGDRQSFLEQLEHPPTPKAARQSAVAEASGLEFLTGETKHTKTKESLFVATPPKRVDRQTYELIASAAKRNNGFWSSFDQRGAIPGFQFKSIKDRNAFLNEMKSVKAPDGDQFERQQSDEAPTGIPERVGDAIIYRDPNTHGIRTEAEAKVRAVVNRLVGQGKAQVHVVDHITDEHGNPTTGVFVRDGNRIFVAHGDLERMAGTANHEAIHFMREAGLLHGNRWKVLEGAAKGWRDEFGINDTYAPDIERWRADGFTDAEINGHLNEEAIATAAARFANGTLAPMPRGFMANVMRAVHEFIEGVRNAVAGKGFNTAVGALRDIQAGRLAGRPTERRIGERATAFQREDKGPTPHGLARMRLLAKERENPVEHIFTIDSDNNVKYAGSGDIESVGFDKGWANRLNDPNEAIHIHHNHPSGKNVSSALSDSDISFLGHDGVVSITAHMNNGDWSSAVLRNSFNNDLFNKSLAPAKAMKAFAAVAYDEAFDQFSNVPAHTIPRDVANAVYQHAANMALDKAGIIHYDTNFQFPMTMAQKKVFDNIVSNIAIHVANIVTQSEAFGRDYSKDIEHANDLTDTKLPGVAGGVERFLRSRNEHAARGRLRWSESSDGGSLEKNPGSREETGVNGDARRGPGSESALNASDFTRTTGVAGKPGGVERFLRARGESLGRRRPGWLEQSARPFSQESGSGGVETGSRRSSVENKSEERLRSIPAALSKTPIGRTLAEINDNEHVKGFWDGLKEIRDDLAMKVLPMAVGSERAQKTMGKFANEMRWAHERFHRIDDLLKAAYDAPARAKMGRAMDEQAVLERTLKAMRKEWLARGESVADVDAFEAGQRAQFAADGRGLHALDPKQQWYVEQLNKAGKEVWRQMQAVGIIDGNAEGWDYYMPRQLVRVSEDGAKRVSKAGAEGGLTSMDQVGRNLTTAGPKRRKYLTWEETQEAGRLAFGDDTALVSDIRAVGIALSKNMRAVAGRGLVNSLREMGKKSGVEIVREGAVGPEDKGAYFTLEHPALTTRQPRLEDKVIQPAELTRRGIWWNNEARDQGLYRSDGASIDQASEGYKLKGWNEDGTPIVSHLEQVVDKLTGKPQFYTVPLKILKEFEGPLRAVLTTPNGAAYNALMRVKAGAMNAIMFSPMIHNMVEFGRAFPLLPGKMLTLRVYRDGFTAKHDDAVMKESTLHGLSPIARSWHQDITGIADEALKDPQATTLGKLGHFWHQTMLWDRIADLQMGIYVNMRDAALKKGLDYDSACTAAAHLANRYAGALPMEAMSGAAHKLANMALFSRSFTIGNLGVLKDLFTGAPQNVLNSVDVLHREAAKSFLKSKAIHAITLDLGLMLAMNGLVQAGIGVMSGNEEWGDEERAFIDRMKLLGARVAEHPLDVLLDPIDVARMATPNWQNEPGKESRIFAGKDATGRGIYIRNPFGKIGEEFSNWLNEPVGMINEKLSPLAHGTLGALTNNAGFNRPVFNTDDKSGVGIVKAIGNCLEYIVEQHFPMQAIQGVQDVGRHYIYGTPGSGLDATKFLAPMVGITVSSGHPGGPQAGAAAATIKQHDAEKLAVSATARRWVAEGFETEAREAMTKAGMTEGEQTSIIRQARNLGNSNRTIRKADTLINSERRGADSTDRATDIDIAKWKRDNVNNYGAR